MKKMLIVALLLLVSLISASTLLITPSKAQTKHEISGYILDSDGLGISGAQVIFNVPSIIPAVFSDNSGHYTALAPSGTYHMNVWPPYDTSYVSYDEPNLMIVADTAKNITLSSGFKVSGYLSNTLGAPITGAVISLNSFCAGWFSNSAGYYFVSVPAGSYTLNAHPRTGTYQSPTTDFPPYNEYNFLVSSNIIKNITVGKASPSPSASPDQTKYKVSGYVLDSSGKGIGKANVIFNVPSIVPSVWTDSSGYYEMNAPAGTYHANVWPPFDSSYINYDEPALIVSTSTAKNVTLHSGIKVSGYIKDTTGTPVVGACVSLNNFGSGWFSNASGYYFLSVPAGIYTMKVQPRSGYNYQGPTTSFPTYSEYNFNVLSDTSKNITVLNQKPTPTLLPTNFPTPTPTHNNSTTVSPTQLPTIASVLIDEFQEIAESPTTINPPDQTAWIALTIGLIMVVIVLAFVAKKRYSTQQVE